MSRASFQLFKKGRVSPKRGRAPRPAKTASIGRTLDTHHNLTLDYCNMITHLLMLFVMIMFRS